MQEKIAWKKSPLDRLRDLRGWWRVVWRRFVNRGTQSNCGEHIVTSQQSVQPLPAPKRKFRFWQQKRFLLFSWTEPTRFSTQRQALYEDWTSPRETPEQGSCSGREGPSTSACSSDPLNCIHRPANGCFIKKVVVSKWTRRRRSQL